MSLSKIGNPKEKIFLGDEEKTPEELKEELQKNIYEYNKDRLEELIKQGNFYAIKHMIENKQVDLNCIFKNREMPLHFAVRSKEDDIIKLMLEKGADPKKRNGLGKTAIEYAKQFYPRSLKYFI